MKPTEIRPGTAARPHVADRSSSRRSRGASCRRATTVTSKTTKLAMALFPTITRSKVTSRPIRGPTSNAIAAATASEPKISAAARNARRWRRGGVGNE